jgi:hypothetical protein
MLAYLATGILYGVLYGLGGLWIAQILFGAVMLLIVAARILSRRKPT